MDWVGLVNQPVPRPGRNILGCSISRVLAGLSPVEVPGVLHVLGRSHRTVWWTHAAAVVWAVWSACGTVGWAVVIRRLVTNFQVFLKTLKCGSVSLTLQHHEYVLQLGLDGTEPSTQTAVFLFLLILRLLDAGFHKTVSVVQISFCGHLLHA